MLSRQSYRVLWLACAMVGGLSVPLTAAEKTAAWTGGGDGVSYSDWANWSIDGGGNPAHEVPINNASDTYAVTIPAAANVTFDVPNPPAGSNEVDRLSLATDGTLTINPGRGLSVSDTAVIGGIVQTVSGRFLGPSDASMLTGKKAKLLVSAAGVVTLGAASYDSRGIQSGVILSADGAGAALNLPLLQTITDSSDFFPSRVRTIQAANGGRIDLSGLIAVHSATGDDVTQFVESAGGRIDLSSLLTVSNNVAFISDRAAFSLPNLQTATNMTFSLNPGYSLSLPALTLQTGGAYNLLAADAVSLPSLTKLQGARVTIGDAASSFQSPLLANIDNTFFNLSGGAQLALSIVSYTGTGFAGGTFLSAAGTGTRLDLSALGSLDTYVDQFPAQVRTISATESGTIDLSGLTAMKGAKGDDKLRIVASSGGLVDLSALRSVTIGTVVFDVDAGGALKLGGFTVTGSTTINVNDATSVVEVGGSLLLDSGATLKYSAAGQLSVRGNFSFATQTETALSARSGILALDGAGTFGNPQLLEVGGLDLGPADPANNGNFGIGQLIVGADGRRTVASLVDEIDNGNRGSPEALYLFGLGGPDGLVLKGGSTLVIDNIHVYAWINGGWMLLNDLVPSGMTYIDFAAITNNPADDGYIAVPVPATLALLGLGALLAAMRRRRRSFLRVAGAAAVAAAGRWGRAALLAGATMAALAALAAQADGPGLQPAAAVKVEVKQDDAAGKLSVMLDGREAFAYHYADTVDLPYIVPRSPSGKALTVVRTEPYPHHRSVWFADTVQLAGQRKASFYNAFYSRKDKKDPNSPFMDHIRCLKVQSIRAEGGEALLDARLLWEMDRKTPVLDESRRMRLVALGDGEYLLDLGFVLMAGYGDVAFLSDAVHYGWPFVRITPEFSVDKGGTMADSEGRRGQKATCNQKAWWVDSANTVGGATEGLAFLVHPTSGGPPKWLTRDYGCIGPRREDDRSGKPFTLKKGESLRRRVALLIHRGDVQAGKVAERYRRYAAMELEDKP